MQYKQLGFDNWMTQDWTRTKNDDSKEMPSLVERFIKKYHDSLAVASNHLPCEAYEQLLQKAIELYPDNDQSARHLAQYYVKQGRKEDAEKMYRKLLLTLNKFYVWFELAQITDDIELKKSALCKALLSERKEEFVGEVHLDLAALFIAEEAYREASCELNICAATYKRNNWRPKDQYRLLII